MSRRRGAWTGGPVARAMAGVCLAVLVLMLIASLEMHAAHAIKYSYPKFTWRKKSQGGKRVRKAFQLCEQYCDGRRFNEVDYFNCVRKCVSPHCFDILYAHDPYELGEIDVRHNSFRGCASSRFKSGERSIDTIRELMRQQPAAPH